MAFFRIILPDILQEKKLKLPVKFATLHGGKLTESARLSLPNGRFWDVRVVKGSEEGKFWFDDGWNSFVEENSVSEYWFLAFKYTGASSFKVWIFDLTTCEISYPSADDGDDPSVEVLGSTPPNPPRHQQSSQYAAAEDGDDDDDSDNDSVVFLGSAPPLKKKKDSNATASRQLPETESSDSDGEEEDDEDDGELGEMLVKELKRRRICVNIKLQRSLPKMSMEIQRAVKAAMAVEFAGSNVPSFLVVMQPHNCNPHSCRLLMPREFVKKHMRNAATVTLKLPGGGFAWEAKTRFSEGGLYLYGEFGKFYRDNDLKDGDVCLFELISKVNHVFHVSISRAALNV